ncbi:hypothetical protein [Streptosporangium sp. NPDC000396]|uniref:hypothetical protein n=1 Tax=Streptosporangium sp. NPDC000396 TaxID=3366185 RepID=UPI003687E100
MQAGFGSNMRDKSGSITISSAFPQVVVLDISFYVKPSKPRSISAPTAASGSSPPEYHLMIICSSAGKDSLAMLAYLAQLIKEQGYRGRVVVVYNHLGYTASGHPIVRSDDFVGVVGHWTFVCWARWRSSATTGGRAGSARRSCARW